MTANKGQDIGRGVWGNLPIIKPVLSRKVLFAYDNRSFGIQSIRTYCFGFPHKQAIDLLTTEK